MPIRDDEENSENADGAAATVEAPKSGIRDWMSGRRGWLIIAVLAVTQALFALILLYFRADVRPAVNDAPVRMQELMVEMLGHEVAFKDIYLYKPLRGGKRFSLALDMVLLLGQLPAERVAGAPHPTEAEFELFVAAIRDMEPRIRSRMNTLLQGMPPESYSGPEAFKALKEEVQSLVNDGLEALDFGKGLRPDIGKRRVTEVLFPQFLRQFS